MQRSVAGMSEVLGALAVVADLGVGVPEETGIGAAILAGRIGRRLGLPDHECGDLFYASLLRFVGCSVAVPETIDLTLGDVHGYQRALALADLGDRDEILRRLDEQMAAESPANARRASIETIGGILEDPQIMGAVSQSHCDLAAQLARDVGLPEPVPAALDQIYERFDGQGLPHGTTGSDLTLAARVLHLTTAFELHRRTLGAASACDQVKARCGGQFDPEICAVVMTAPEELIKGMDGATLLDLFIDEDPTGFSITADRLIDVARACGQNVDHRSVYTLGHSGGVADLLGSVAETADLTPEVGVMLQIAGHLHDVGRAGVSSAIWDKPGPLTRSERVMVEHHSYLTDRVLRASPALTPYAAIASSAHERLDGGGYHKRLDSPSFLGQLLAASDMFHAMREERPWRRALSAAAASDELLEEAREGRLDRAAVEAVLDAVEGRSSRRVVLPNDLSAREAEVLCCVARGLTNKQIAAELYISVKTVENHVGRVYDKIGARTRTAAAMFAVRHRLCTK